VNTSFSQRLAAVQNQKQSHLCVGIDPDFNRLPPHLGDNRISATRAFCTGIIDSTASSACAYKFNFAFFEALGSAGIQLLGELVPFAQKHALTIADAKRGDIGNSASFYAQSIFDHLHFDAVTVAPYMGRDAVQPFLTRPGTCAFVLVRTSNPGGNDLQLLNANGVPLFEQVARQVVSWGESLPAETGFVVGATDLSAMTRLRAAHPSIPFLVPGVGQQGGNARDVMAAAAGGPVLVNSSRSILYASHGEDFVEAAARIASELAAQLRPAVRERAPEPGRTPTSPSAPVAASHRLYRTVRMSFKSEHVDTFLRLFEDARPHIESFPGCETLLLLEDVEQPNVFTTLSTWTSDSALEAYRASGFFKATWSKTRPLFSERPVANSYRSQRDSVR